MKTVHLVYELWPLARGEKSCSSTVKWKKCEFKLVKFINFSAGLMYINPFKKNQPFLHSATAGNIIICFITNATRCKLKPHHSLYGQIEVKCCSFVRYADEILRFKFNGFCQRVKERWKCKVWFSFVLFYADYFLDYVY